MKNKLKERQPVVYQVLKNALQNDKIAHAYLFHGPKGTLKKESAILFAQSILCKGNDFACEHCDLCRRIKEGTYHDVIYLDASDTSLKKDEVLKLQKDFSKTSLEKGGKKIYIIDRIENATVDALNSLLKFIEEPSGDMIAILLAQQLERVLPTIVSRCQVITFKSSGFKVIYEEQKANFDALDAFLLAHLVNDGDKMMELSEDEDYQHARYVFMKIIGLMFNNYDEALFFMQSEAFEAKNKKYGKQAMLYLLDMLFIFCKDGIKQRSDCEDQTYLDYLKQYQKVNYQQIMKYIMESKDLLLKSCNLALLIDQLFYKMRGEF